MTRHPQSQPTAHPAAHLDQVGVVAIGRNEGERLGRCIDSIPSGIRGAVYVDSGSTDESMTVARSRGVDVVELDMSVPFTAGRARNAGFDRLLAKYPDIEMVHFVDGDCELVPGAVEAVVAEMRSAPDIVGVCGWTRERHPERTPFNALCDIEWRMRPVGDTQAFGGIFLVRASAFRQVGGFDPQVIAAEDDELAPARDGRRERERDEDRERRVRDDARVERRDAIAEGEHDGPVATVGGAHGAARGHAEARRRRGRARERDERVAVGGERRRERAAPARPRREQHDDERREHEDGATIDGRHEARHAAPCPAPPCAQRDQARNAPAASATSASGQTSAWIVSKADGQRRSM